MPPFSQYIGIVGVNNVRDSSTEVLNRELSDEVYMPQAPRFEAKNSRGRPLFVMKFHRSSFVLGQWQKAWNGTIERDIRTMGFLRTTSDACVYTKDVRDNYVMLTSHMDALLITGPK